VERQVNLSNQVLVAVVDRGQSAFLVAANVRRFSDATFRGQVGLGQSNHIRLFNGTARAKFLAFVKARLSSDVVISVPNQGIWKLSGCVVSNYNGPALSSTSNDVAIEEIEISHEGIELQK
jgi:tail tube protein gp19